MLDLNELTEEQYLSELKMMFLTPGWAIFQAEVADMASILNNIQDVSSEQDLWVKRGRLDQMGITLNYQSSIERAEKEADEKE
jgi:hypothetical protein